MCGVQWGRHWSLRRRSSFEPFLMNETILVGDNRKVLIWSFVGLSEHRFLLRYANRTPANSQIPILFFFAQPWIDSFRLLLKDRDNNNPEMSAFFLNRIFNYRFDSCLGKKIDPRFMIQCLSLWFFFFFFFCNIIIVIDDFWSPWVRPKTCCLLIVGDILHPSHLSPPDLCVGLRNERFITEDHHKTVLNGAARRGGCFAATTRQFVVATWFRRF